MKQELTWSQHNSKVVTAEIGIQVDSKGFLEFFIVQYSKVYSEFRWFPMLFPGRFSP
jgi:hypothetical protein